MCIIVAKDKFHKLPKEEYLKNCFDNNPDGAGFMYVDNNNDVIIDKGYMTYKSFLKRYHKLCKKYNDFTNKALVMHFRIGTAGANSKENTHPYPITYDKEILHKNYYHTSLGMAHNGIIRDYNPPSDVHDLNDTQNFIIKYLYPLYKHYPKFYKNKYIMEGLYSVTNSKLAFLDKYDNIYLVGDFVSDSEGIKYSNTNYLPYTRYDYRKYDLTNYNSYFDRYYDLYDDYDYVSHKSELKKEDEDFLNDDSDLPINKDTSADVNEITLDKKWYYSINEKNFEKVGDRNLVYDYYYGILYEVNEMGDYIYLGENVMIYDENGEEMLF